MQSNVNSKKSAEVAHSNYFRMEVPDQNKNSDPPASGGFKVFDIPQSKEQTPPPEQPTSGFRAFGKPPAAPKTVVPPVPQKPAVVNPPRQALPNAEVREGPTAGQAISSAMHRLGDWFTRNRKGVLIGAGGIAGLIVLILTIKFLLSLDFASSNPSDAAAPNADSSAAEVATKPLPKSNDTSPATSAPSAKRVVTDSEPDIEPATGYGFVKAESGTKVNLHEKPSKMAPVIKSLPNGSFVHIRGYSKRLDRIDGENGKWCKISHVGTEGWVWGKFISKK